MPYEWRDLVKRFRAFTQMRQSHHARMNRTRNRDFRSLEHRTACLQSALGRRVGQAQLFEEFFDLPHLTPGEMAARLLHEERRRGLRAAAQAAQAKAKSAPSVDRREFWQAQSQRAERALEKLPSWRTLYRRSRTGR